MSWDNIPQFKLIMEAYTVASFKAKFGVTQLQIWQSEERVGKDGDPIFFFTSAEPACKGYVSHAAGAECFKEKPDIQALEVQWNDQLSCWAIQMRPTGGKSVFI